MTGTITRSSMAESDDHVDLISVEPIEAVRIKFERGRSQHGVDWVGARPIVEAHAEVLDALAYCMSERENWISGFSGEKLSEEVLDQLIGRLLDVLQGVRILIEGSGALGVENGSQDGPAGVGGTGPHCPDEDGGGNGSV